MDKLYQTADAKINQALWGRPYTVGTKFMDDRYGIKRIKILLEKMVQ